MLLFKSVKSISVELFPYPKLHFVPGLLLRIDAENLLLFGHLHISFMALPEVVQLRTQQTMGLTHL